MTFFFILSGASFAADLTCLTLVGDSTGTARIDAVSLADGTVTTVIDGASADVSDVRSLAFADGAVWTCEDEELVSFALADATRTEHATACRGVGASASGELLLLASAGSTSSVYTSATVAAVSTEAATASPRLGIATSAAIDGTDALVVGPSGTYIRRRALADGAVVGWLEIDDLNGPTWGLAVVDGVVYVLDDGRDGTAWNAPAIRSYDAVTAAPVAVVELPYAPLAGERPHGLWCGAR